MLNGYSNLATELKPPQYQFVTPANSWVVWSRSINLFHFTRMISVWQWEGVIRAVGSVGWATDQAGQELAFVCNGLSVERWSPHVSAYCPSDTVLQFEEDLFFLWALVQNTKETPPERKLVCLTSKSPPEKYCCIRMEIVFPKTYYTFYEFTITYYYLYLFIIL